MARKSRKNIIKNDIVETKKIYKAAAYIRLSAENEITLAVGSLNNQIEFVKDYISLQADMELYDIYIDDDITGTHFNRPEFQRMMSDVEKGNVNAVVVKDLSRLGRSFYETSELVEMTFPTKKVRVIAINNNYDSDKKEAGLTEAITNLMNDYYSRDISKKICAAKDTMLKNGIPTGKVPYGYKLVKDENNANQMVIDEEPSEVVKMIFGLFTNGKTRTEIVNILNEKGIMTSYCYRLHKTPEKLADKPYLKWNYGNVTAILTNDVYTGRYVTGKRKKAYYKNEGNHFVPQDEWNVFENHHPAIISKTDFEKAAEKIGKRNNTKVNNSRNLLKGKVFCSCGAAMVLCGGSYTCCRKRAYGTEVCAGDSVSAKKMHEMLQEVIQKMGAMLIDEDTLVKKVSEENGTAKKKNILVSEKKAKEQRLAKIKEIKVGLYFDYKDGVLTTDDFKNMNIGYTAQIEALQNEISAIEAEIADLNKNPADDIKLRKFIREFKRCKKLTQEHIDTYIDKITVYDKQHIEICFAFDDPFIAATEKQEKELVVNE